MGVTISVLGSGSRGNATFIKTDTVRLLIDAGLSRKELMARLESIGEDPHGIDAILVTHEHTDHSAGLKTLIKEESIQVCMTRGTAGALGAESYEWNGSTLLPVTPGQGFMIGDVEVLPYRVPHDAAEPVAYRVRCGGFQLNQVTDIGHVSDTVVEHLRGANVLILESNHDLEMLRVGPYPWNLKQRLMGRYGHLSNTAAAQFIRDQFDGAASHVVLAHLSSRNNHPELARQETSRALAGRGLASTTLVVTTQDEAGRPIYLS
jgi:phosphoribosyl 1,2-cyclic phosphodiesterase